MISIKNLSKKLMQYLISFFRFILIKLIFIIQFFKYRILKKPFKVNKIDLFKHRLNFYSYRLKGRKTLTLSNNYIFKKDISTEFLNIDINKFIGYNGSYIYEGDAPLLKTAIEIYKNPEINVEESFLYHFYKDFQPQNYGELYKLSKTNSLTTISSFLDFKPWIHDFPNCKEKSKGIFGPIDKIEIKHRIIRIKNLFTNIEKYGYVSSEDDIIKGYLMLMKNDYKFLVTSGNHRIAVLKTLNIFNKEKFNNISVKFDHKRATQKIIDIKNINKWPAISSKFCSIEDALELFNKYCFG